MNTKRKRKIIKFKESISRINLEINWKSCLLELLGDTLQKLLFKMSRSLWYNIKKVIFEVTIRIYLITK